MRLKRHKINVLGVDVDDISLEKAVSQILKLSKGKTGGHLVVTVNAEFVMLARRMGEFHKILDEADLALADGQWVVFSKQILGGKVQNRIAGVDLVEKLCAEGAKNAVRIGFLGGFGSVAEVVANRQKKKNLGLEVVFAGSGDPTIGSDLRLKGALDAVGRVDILFVAFGMGRQEFWIKRNLKKLNVGVFIGVGGAFDYLSQTKQRAPKTMQKTGFEWLWRLISEPNRAWRMRVLPLFLVFVLGQWVLNFRNLRKS